MAGLTGVALNNLVVTKSLLIVNVEARDTAMSVTQSIAEISKGSRVWLSVGHPSDSASNISVEISGAEELANHIRHELNFDSGKIKDIHPLQGHINMLKISREVVCIMILIEISRRNEE